MMNFATSPIRVDLEGMDFNGSKTAQDDRHREVSRKFKGMIEGFHQLTSGFYEAVQNPLLSQVEASRQLASTVSDSIEDCLFIGIGGSSLGPLCLLDSLKHRFQRKIRFHFFENPDPTDWSHRIASLDPKKTLVCVVTKSGTTYETLALFMLAFDWLKRSLSAGQAALQTVAITDPERGELREFCQREKIALLSIHPSIGGRYSVFSPVGLFAGFLAGLDMNQFLTGAASVRNFCESLLQNQNLANPFLIWAESLDERRLTQPIHVMMPYSTPLKTAANWWVQLWAESLGKSGRGFTPVPALGAVDQHSVLQLLRDGPNDKVTWFVSVKNQGPKVTIPSIQFPIKTFDLLTGQDLGGLLDTEFRAIQRVMMNQKRPHLHIEIDELSESAMGAFFFTLCVLTATQALLLNVDPFDQPGVEEGKIYIREKLVEKKRTLR